MVWKLWVCVVFCLPLIASCSHSTNQVGSLVPLSPPSIPLGYSPLGNIIGSPDGRFVYVPFFLQSSCVTYARNPATGKLTFHQNTTILPHPCHELTVVMSPDGSSMYFTCYQSISTYSRNIANGELTFLQTIYYNLPYHGQCNQFVISPEGNNVYVTCSGSDYLLEFARDVSTGRLMLTQTLQTGYFPATISISPDGISVYTVEGVDDIICYKRNFSTGNLTIQDGTSSGLNNGISDMAISPDGLNVYVIGSLLLIYSRNQSCHLELLTNVSGIVNGGQVIVSPDGLSVYVLGSSQLYQYHRNTQTGLLKALSPPAVTISEGLSSGLMVMLPDSNNVYVVINNATNPNFEGQVDQFRRVI